MFLTGSIAYALRAVHQWMLGVSPRLDGLVVDPCIPKSYKTLSARVQHLNRLVTLTIRNERERECGVRSLSINGQPVTTTRVDPFSGRVLFVVGDDSRWKQGIKYACVSNA